MTLKNKKGFVYLAFIFVAVFITLLYAYSIVTNTGEKRTTGDIAGKIMDIQTQTFRNQVTVRIAAQNTETIVRPVYELGGHLTDCGTLGPIFYWKNKEKACLPPHHNYWYQTMFAGKLNQFLETANMKEYELSPSDIYLDTTDNQIKARSDSEITISSSTTEQSFAHTYNPAFAIPALIDLSYKEIKETIASIDSSCSASQESEVTNCVQSILSKNSKWSTFCGTEEDKLKFKDEICKLSPDKDCSRKDNRIQVFCYTHLKNIFSGTSQTDVTSRFAYEIDDKSPPAIITPDLNSQDSIEWQHSPDPDIKQYQICIKSKLPNAQWTLLDTVSESDYNSGSFSFKNSAIQGKDITIIPIDDNNNQAITCLISP